VPAIVLGGAVLGTGVSQGAVAVFSLAGPGAQGAALDTLSTGSTAVSGITGTFTAFTTGANGGVFHPTSGNFGINSDDGIGGTSDATSLLDAVEGAESLTIKFDQIVNLDSITLSSFSTGGQIGGGASTELADLTIGSGALQQLTATASSQDVYTSFTGSTLLPAGQTITLAYHDTTGANGFSFDAFQVSTPEPSVAGLLVVGSLFGLRRRRA
jgi:MYXO-CTERM domain-containing protein